MSDDATAPTHDSVDSEGTETLRVVLPDGLLDDDLTLLGAALLLADAGLRVLPTTSIPTKRKPHQSARKNPGGMLGKGWPDKSSRDINKLRSWFNPHAAGGHDSGTAHTPEELADMMREDCYRAVPFESIGLAIHVGRDVVVFDIDEPDRVPEAFWAELDTAPFQSTSRTDPRRGHYFFVPRNGFEYGQTSALPERDGLGSAGELRHGQAIVVGAPSSHPKAHLGRRYKFVRAGLLPVMSEELSQWAQKRTQRTAWNGQYLEHGEASLTEVERFRDECTGSMRERITTDHLGWLSAMADDNGLHGTWLPGLIDLIQMAACGYVAANEAIDASEQAFVAIRTNTSRAALGGNVSDEESAISEHDDMVRWALGRVHAKTTADREAVLYETYRQVSRYYWSEAPEIAMPVEYVALETSRFERMWYHPKERCDDQGRQLCSAQDGDMADKIAVHLRDRYLYVTENKQWMGWSEAEQLWKPISKEQFVATVLYPLFETQFATTITVPRLDAFRKTDDPDTLLVLERLHGPCRSFYKLSSQAGKSVRHREAVERDLAGVLGRSIEEMDVQGDWLPVANGMINARTGEFRDSSPADLVSKRMPVSYDPKAKCPNFIRILTEAAQQTGEDPSQGVTYAALIQRYLGCAVLGIEETRVTQGMLYVWGATASGKSMLFDRTLNALFSGGHNVGLLGSVDSNVFMKRNSAGFDLAPHSGCRLLVANELPKRRIDSEFLKKVTDGSPVMAAHKFGKQFSMTLGRLIILSNHLPSFDDWDPAVARRLITVEFDHTPAAIDPHLYDREIKPELSGILNWVLEGAKAYLSIGLAIPALSMERDVEEVMKRASSPALFLSETFMGAGPGEESQQLLMTDLLALYQDWAKMRGITLPDDPRRSLISTIEAQFGRDCLCLNRRDNDKRQFLAPDLIVVDYEALTTKDKRKMQFVTGLIPSDNAPTRVEIHPPGVDVLDHMRVKLGELGHAFAQRSDVEEWRKQNSGRRNMAPTFVGRARLRVVKPTEDGEPQEVRNP